MILFHVELSYFAKCTSLYKTWYLKKWHSLSEVITAFIIELSFEALFNKIIARLIESMNKSWD